MCNALFLQRNATPERMYKVVLCGDAAVGKSSFILRLCKNKFIRNLHSTLGVDFQTKILDVDGRIIALQLWDTAGQERCANVDMSSVVLYIVDVLCVSRTHHITLRIVAVTTFKVRVQSQLVCMTMYEENSFIRYDVSGFGVSPSRTSGALTVSSCCTTSRTSAPSSTSGNG